MAANLKACPKCDAVIKEDICLNCGYVPESYKKNKEKAKKTEDKAPSNKETSSLFAKFQDNEDENLADLISTRQKALMPVILGVVLLLLSVLSYWRFIYLTPDFVSPLVLSAMDVKERVTEPAVLNVNRPTFTSAENERTVQLDSDLSDGNFAQGDFAIFGSLDTALMIQAFNVENIMTKFVNEDLMNKVKDVFDISGDDLDVYFSNGFAILFPSPSMERWGFVIQISDKDFVLERVKVFGDEERDNLSKDFKDYYAQVVTVEKVPDEDKAYEGPSDPEKSSSGVHYLLISNSREYLDQMKESSEGNVVNLANDLGFTQSRIDLPAVGEVYVYNRSPDLWARLAEKVASKYDFVGLDKVLSQLDSTGTVFYSKDGKLKIVHSAN